MIFDTKENLAKYKVFGPNYEKAVDFLLNNDLETLENGKYEIDGKNVYANVMDLTTVPWEEGKFETHEHYTDIQYIVRGVEVMSYAPKNLMTPKTEYNPEKDVTFYTNDVRGFDIPVTAGTYAIFQLPDAHKPKVMLDAPGAVKKIVVKVKED